MTADGLLELSATVPTGSTELEQLVSLTRAVAREAPGHLAAVAQLMADGDLDYRRVNQPSPCLLTYLACQLCWSDRGWGCARAPAS